MLAQILGTVDGASVFESGREGLIDSHVSISLTDERG